MHSGNGIRSSSALRQDRKKGCVRFTPESGHFVVPEQCLLWANSGLLSDSSLFRLHLKQGQ
jgi:hypothetical protein